MSKENAKGFVASFKEFISKGNIIDMAVGVVIGGSFSKIVTGLVNNIINPFVAIFVKSGSLDSIKTIITPAITDSEGVVTTPEVAILWGTWVQTIIDFIITALCIFIILRIFLKAKEKINRKNLEQQKQKALEEEAKANKEKELEQQKQEQAVQKQQALEQSILAQEKLLGEIRDALKQK